MGTERVFRQFVDGLGIDEHLTQDIYNAQGTAVEKTVWYHENARGDTVVLSDKDGNITAKIAYSAYGEAYKIGENGELENLEGEDSLVYGFQGRQIDEETGLFYFRNRYYEPKAGRFISRDPFEYVDSFGLYEAFGGTPQNITDVYGTQQNLEDYWKQLKDRAIDTAVKYLNSKLDEIKKESDPTKQLQLIENFYRMLAGGGYIFNPLAAQFMSRWLNKSGDIILPHSMFQGTTLNGDMDYIIDSILEEVKCCQSSPISFAKKTDINLAGNFFLAINAATLIAKGFYTSGPCINSKCIVQLDIQWTLQDTYDWHPGGSAYILSSPISNERVLVEDDLAFKLEKAGRAKSFKITSTWNEIRKIELECSEK
ncbi:MAG: RHS repeat-associated core domain-containing protein [Nitrospirae bacterium]|nr:RHS repeat-associated core domain-containing protein [Nitrospirota bacterium]